ncbi:unnamed protein product [Prunus armeniaca]|uniref:Uncharacterized protein n=1 Tax=Prunus armeniaca TaxID=36596 RepID=A0A6J5W1S6_PRUAR|nr:unnamed protein product [Prunus armeniaca]
MQDPSGVFLASVSEDYVRVWSFGPRSKGKCIHELYSTDNKFHCCVFHPTYPSIMIIGSDQASQFSIIVQTSLDLTLPLRCIIAYNCERRFSPKPELKDVGLNIMLVLLHCESG